MIFLFVGLLIWFYSLKHLKKAFLFFLIYKIFLVTNINVLSLPGVPILSLDMCLTLWFFFWILRKKKMLHFCQRSMPFHKPMIFIAVVYFISALFSVAGFGSALSAYIKDLCGIFITPWMIWKVVETEKDFIFLIKGMMVAFFITCIYAFIENYIQANPLVEYETTLVQDSSRVIDFRYDIDELRGYRVQSVFEHPIGAGLNWAMFAVLMLFLWWTKECQNLRLNVYFVFLLAILCILCIFISNCRAPLLFLVVVSGGFISFKRKKFYNILLSIVLFILLINILGSESYLNNFLSIFNSDYQDKVGGSNYEMRISQMQATLNLLEHSPIWGLGYKFYNIINDVNTKSLLGLESMWFRILTQFGLLGFFANVSLAYYSIIKIPKRLHMPIIFWFCLAYWVTGSLTSVPGMLMYLYYLVIFYLIKRKYMENLAHLHYNNDQMKVKFS